MQRLPKLTWIGGAFLFDEDAEAEVRITVYPAIQLRPFSNYGTNARALFGQATYNVSKRVSLTGGVRYTTERKDLHTTDGMRPSDHRPIPASIPYVIGSLVRWGVTASAAGDSTQPPSG